MSDETTEVAATPVEAAPVAGTDVDTAPVSSEEAVAATSSSTEKVDETTASKPSTTEPQVPSFPTTDDFGWDAWDGKADTLPEQVRPWGDKLSQHYLSQFEKTRAEESAETERLRGIYEALMSGQEDPRTREVTEKLEALQAKYEEMEKSSLTTQNDFTEYKKAVDRAIDEEAEAYASWYQTQYPQFFNDKEMSEKFTKLLESGWDLQYAPAAMELSDDALEIAQKAMSENVPMKYAVELARKSSGVAPKPRPGARITSGATGSPSAPNQVRKDTSDEVKTFDDMRLIAAQNAFKRR